MKWLRHAFPAPLLSASLLAMWLVINGSVSLGHWLIGTFVAIAVPLATSSLRPSPVRIRHPWTLTKLILLVGRDVLVSNLDVARGVFRARKTPPHGKFVHVPIELTDPHAIAALAAICCVIPGTVWSEMSLDRRWLLLHVFDLDDEQAFIDHLKTCYEKPLLEIFE